MPEITKIIEELEEMEKPNAISISDSQGYSRWYYRRDEMDRYLAWLKSHVAIKALEFALSQTKTPQQIHDEKMWGPGGPPEYRVGSAGEK